MVNSKHKMKKTVPSAPEQVLFSPIATAIDPTLAALFASSLHPTDSPKQPRTLSQPTAVQEIPLIKASIGNELLGRKRKRREAEDDLEEQYLRRLTQEQDGNKKKRRLEKNDRRATSNEAIDLYEEAFANLGEVDTTPDEKNVSDHTEGGSEADEVEITTDAGQQPCSIVPRHESVASQPKNELEKASRTVFLGNVSTTAIKSKAVRKKLLDHLISFTPSLKSDSVHKVESLRFRSTAFASSAVPKKAAYVKQELMDATTTSTNAYVVYNTSLAAREATKRLNGTIVLDRHLRVDSVAHPARQDHRRCVFVGNLGFVDDESAINAAEDEMNGKRVRKAKEPADLEEGLWRQFGKAGKVESVRVVRDKTTRVGKGIAYVQFQDPNAIEKALLYNGKKFPPMLPRILRVTRAKSVSKTASHSISTRTPDRSPHPSRSPGHFTLKPSSQVQSLSGRASKLLGRAGASQFNGRRAPRREQKGFESVLSKNPENIVFEGYRASSKQGRNALKLGGSGKKQGKPRTRSSKRGAAFKLAGSKKRKK